MVVIIMVKEGAEMQRSRQLWVSLAIQRTQTTEVTLTMFLSVDSFYLKAPASIQMM